MSISVAQEATSAADHPKEVGAGEFGIKFGILGEGDVEYREQGSHASPETMTTESSYSGGAFFSQRLYRRLHWTVGLDIHYMRDRFSGQAGLDAAAGLKYRWVDPSGSVSVRPAALLGFGIIPDVWRFKSSQYMTFKIMLELAFLTKKGTGLLIEVGRLRTFSGSDGTYDIEAGPMTLIRGGVIL
jgi:hypothetical protein